MVLEMRGRLCFPMEIHSRPPNSKYLCLTSFEIQVHRKTQPTPNLKYLMFAPLPPPFPQYLKWGGGCVSVATFSVDPHSKDQNGRYIGYLVMRGVTHSEYL